MHDYEDYGTSNLAASREALWAHLLAQHEQAAIDPDKHGIEFVAMTIAHRALHGLARPEKTAVHPAYPPLPRYY